jgi:hypothetical protein
MKPQYIEGSTAKENFEQGMKALFRVSKAAVVRQKKSGKRTPKTVSVRKTKRSDKD